MINDLQKAARDLSLYAFIPYKGCIIERTGNKFSIYSGRYTFNTLEEAKAKIDEPIILKKAI